MSISLPTTNISVQPLPAGINDTADSLLVRLQIAVDTGPERNPKPVCLGATGKLTQIDIYDYCVGSTNNSTNDWKG